ncbi:related to PBS2 - tyrosine protein kinase of the MAPKK family [Pseudozyma flocculosa]|uniref:mitogen-activated protein kinase kinase n=1 Tax=Pseudozyma flocculosa TaxID=84751 RepID=A0A5C3F3C7_9BASI|nr:related to PBS2 - tyrosine protein kinase of the MAPKK family [Pseudozyma flocculosa]
MSNPTADLGRMTSNLSLNDPSTSSSASPSGSSQPPSQSPSRPMPPHNGMASLQQRATGGPPSRSPGMLPPGSRPMGPGGPIPPRGGVAGLNERTRQMASTKLPPSLQAKLAANANRSASGGSSPSPGVLGHDQKIDSSSLLGSAGGMGSLTPSLGLGGLAARRAAMGGLGSGAGSPVSAGGPPGAGMGARRNRPGLKLSDMGISPSEGVGSPAPSSSSSSSASSGGLGGEDANGSGAMSSPFSNFSKIVDPSGRLNFSGKAVLHASGVEFGNGTSFQIKMEDLELMDELGKGNYGTVRKVRHTRTKVDMAMKEIRLELDESKLNGIIMELDILHRAISPQIVEFYGAFFIESCVYYCMEFMDAGSLDKLCWGRATVPEDVLARITRSMVLGLSFLKDELQIIHRDVKPTNVLVNRKGEVKLCDFGVSGQLEKSLAKTNIGCQSYMAPERIKGESQNMLGTYTVASDVWSLGLSIVEMTQGTYPYPPETYSNVFAQLQAIVHGDPPELPAEIYSDTAKDFVARCLEKVPGRRPTYAQLLQDRFLLQDEERGQGGVDMVGWVNLAIEERSKKRERERSEAEAQGQGKGQGSGSGEPSPAAGAGAGAGAGLDAQAPELAAAQNAEAPTSTPSPTQPQP